MKKTCTKCREDKEITEFSSCKRNKDGKSYNCKICVNAYYKDLYSRSNDRKEYLKSQSKKNKIKTKTWVKNYLQNNPCVDCGESDYIVLEFDHIDSSEKSFNISDGMMSKSINTIKKEIEKCEVRCSNCHRRKTAKQFNWYDY